MKRASTSLATPDATKKKRVSFNSVVEFRELTTTTPESTPTTPATTTRATTSDGEPVAANKSPVDDAENATAPNRRRRNVSSSDNNFSSASNSGVVGSATATATTSTRTRSPFALPPALVELDAMFAALDTVLCQFGFRKRLAVLFDLQSAVEAQSQRCAFCL